MSYNSRKIKRDGDSIPVPQYFNDTLDDFEVQKGSNGAAFMQLTGSIVEVTRGTVSVAAGATTAVLSNIQNLEKYKELLVLVLAPYSYDIIQYPSYAGITTISSSFVTSQGQTFGTYRAHAYSANSKSYVSALTLQIKNNDATNAGNFTVVLLGVN